VADKSGSEASELTMKDGKNLEVGKNGLDDWRVMEADRRAE
jgi:hypothetical protein